MASLVNNAVFTASAGGAAAFGVAAAAAGYQTPAAAGVIDGKTYRYRAQSTDLSQWEEGSGVSSGTGTSFTRVVTASSAGGTTTVNFTNPPTVALTMFAADVLQFDDAMALTAAQQLQARSNIGVYKTINVSNTDLNNLKTPGIYDGTTLTNSPDGSSNWFYIEVDQHSGFVAGTNEWVLQKAYTLTGGTVAYVRWEQSNIWQPWQRVMFGGNNLSDVANANTALANLGGVSFAVNQGLNAGMRAQARANIGSAINELQNVSFALGATAGALTIALKDAAGNDPTASTPVSLSFRSASPIGAGLTTLEVTAAASITIPSGSTCGFASNAAGRLWIIGWNDAGTFRLGVFNASNPTTIFPLVESNLASSLQTVAGGNSAGQHYTAGAAVASKAFRILGYVDWTSAGMTAGTWTTTNLNSVQTFGPGVRKPGDVVAKYRYSSTTQFSMTSSTYADTTLTGSPTLTNAANLVEIHAEGTADCTISSAQAITQLFRGAVAIGFPILTSNNTGAIAASASLTELDFPNTTSPAYKVRLRNSDNTSTVFFPLIQNGSGAVMTVSEIMG